MMKHDVLLSPDRGRVKQYHESTLNSYFTAKKLYGLVQNRSENYHETDYSEEICFYIRTEVVRNSLSLAYYGGPGQVFVRGRVCDGTKHRGNGCVNQNRKHATAAEANVFHHLKYLH